METFATVGYGGMYPATLYCHCVATTEIFTCIATSALTTGLLFVRSARPTARFRYAANAVIASHKGCSTLMIGIANGRRTILYDASAHLGLLLSLALTVRSCGGFTSCGFLDHSCRYSR